MSNVKINSIAFKHNESNCCQFENKSPKLIPFILRMLGGRLPVKFVLKNHQTSVPENTPSGSVLLTTGVNKADPVSNVKIQR